jgi:site-specific DNA recombinase
MNCILYARVSTDKQANKDLSIPAQLGIMKEYAQKNNWRIKSHYIDDGESARTANRPELKKLIQNCKTEKDVDVILIHKIDRLARNLVDYATIKAILKQNNIRLVSVSEPFEDNPVGNLLENIIASISEWYSANLGEEVKKGSMAKLKKGEWPTKPMYGYKSILGENGRVKHVPDRKTASVVKQCFELFSTGQYSLRTLSEEMASRGFMTKFGNKRSPESMKRLITRRFYIGKLEWKGQEYQGIHKPIISKRLFYQVQKLLNERKTSTGEKGKHKFLLRGIAYCENCGQRLTGEHHKRGSYYRCIPDINKDKCDQSYPPVAILDEQLEGIYEELQPPKKLLKILKAEMELIAKRRMGESKKEIATLKHTIKEYENKEMKLIDEKIDGKIGQNIYEKMLKKYQAKRIAAEDRLSQFEVDYKDPLDFLDKCIVVASSLKYLHDKFSFEKKKLLLKAIFEKIYVRDRAICNVKFNPPFDILLGDKLKKLFEDRPFEAACEDNFEQVRKFTLSEKYIEIKSLIDNLI